MEQQCLSPRKIVVKHFDAIIDEIEQQIETTRVFEEIDNQDQSQAIADMTRHHDAVKGLRDVIDKHGVSDLRSLRDRLRMKWIPINTTIAYQVAMWSKVGLIASIDTLLDLGYNSI